MRNFAAPVLFLLTSVLHAQVPYEEAIADLAKKLNTGLSGTAFKTVLVSPFKQLEGQGCSLSSTITLDLEGGLVAQPKTYKLLDRQNLEALAAEHKLEMNGMMDEEQRMREAGKLLKADAMVFGYFTYAGEFLVLRVKAIDIQTSEQVSVLSATCTPNAMLKALCGTQVVSTSAPLPSPKEPTQVTPSNTVDAECAKKNVGSYCFQNNGQLDLSVQTKFPEPYQGSQRASLLIRPGRTECFYDKPSGSYSYSLVEVSPQNSVYRVDNTKTVGQGTLRFETCGTGQMTYP
ncbi:MAG: hypothetical protein IPO12_01870 [Flavobacteriales bacterium]|nr:hypothetical protein [Flavobacteriales bacterium]